MSGFLDARPTQAESYSVYGGVTAISSEATGFFRVEKINGEWWFIDPDGYAFFSKGVNSIRIKGAPSRDPAEGNPYEAAVREKYGNEREPWDAATIARLKELGFNTIGAWSDPELTRRQQLPYTVVLNVGVQSGADWFGRLFKGDVFDPRFADGARKIIAEKVTPHVDDPWLIGYYLDNELAWNVGSDAFARILVLYLSMEPVAPGKQQALSFLKDRYPDIEAFNNAWDESFPSWDALEANRRLLYPEHERLEQPVRKAPESVIEDADQFLGIVAKRYFHVCHEAFRAVDPNHLILGVRFAWANETILPVVRAAGPYLDVISVNNYWPAPFVDQFRNFTQATGKPVMITEFSFVSTEGDHPNTLGAASKMERKFPTERMRARQFGNYALALLEEPNIVGYHWYCWSDQPVAGRALDGENQSFGVVTLEDTLYPDMKEVFQKVNLSAESWKIETPQVLWP